MPTANHSSAFSNITNTSVSFGGTSDRLTFINSSSCGVTATGLNQTVSLINDSWMVVQNQSPSMLNVLIQGNDANITVNDMTRNMHFTLVHQGAYTITDNTTGPISGAFITTAHSSIFVMGVTAATLAHNVTSVH
ncbi:hypothetical protein [Rhodopila globiformis]|uniref:hypothetical protein n=1 Tax=Rhodopila globiformis TaxID=1071 RepID=UPI0011B0E586|nr:hypothetical protein [Rhodopila globiformis]